MVCCWLLFAVAVVVTLDIATYSKWFAAVAAAAVVAVAAAVAAVAVTLDIATLCSKWFAHLA